MQVHTRCGKYRRLLFGIAWVVGTLACGSATLTTPSKLPSQTSVNMNRRSTRLALWLAQKDELLAHDEAAYDIVFSAWFEPEEAEALRERNPNIKLIAGLTLSWISTEADWLPTLHTIANQGDASGPLRLTEDMYLMFDQDGNGELDTHCSPPGWEQILAVDPRHPGWRELILKYYEVLAAQPHHDGLVVDMLDAYPFCEGAWSVGIPVSLDTASWIDAQEELLALLRQQMPSGKWLMANAGRDFPPDSPFPAYLNGYLLENALGTQFGLGSAEGVLASAERAVINTRPPHIVVFAVDTDDTGIIDWPRFRTGLATSLLIDHAYFAFDFGPRSHGGVDGWWQEAYNAVQLGSPLAGYSYESGVYRRDFEQGVVVVADETEGVISLERPHFALFLGKVDTDFVIPAGDAEILMVEGAE